MAANVLRNDEPQVGGARPSSRGSKIPSQNHNCNVRPCVFHPADAVRVIRRIHACKLLLSRANSWLREKNWQRTFSEMMSPKSVERDHQAAAQKSHLKNHNCNVRPYVFHRADAVRVIRKFSTLAASLHNVRHRSLVDLDLDLLAIRRHRLSFREGQGNGLNHSYWCRFSSSRRAYWVLASFAAIAFS